ncbi:hypothetical protein BJP25_21160 [Actinokineospora bangkokensis]|uniref:CRISPR-associated helicase/endonuclease Cas3 n=1 Tax=Actinokineospora bangkokensis TaxID=1193682 RepID=A0A1Q9LL69_9PSEU|nr:hypothetical protein BJP25_31490 [Actinokineospora bangkokensis]OLR92745.1 hypothetical protein BJP25_21160 [Actinokineospora bangkokensis]
MAWELGLVHDAGKARCAWQEGLLAAGTSGGRVGVPHKEVGASFIAPRAGVAAMAVLGHHGGLHSRSWLLRLLRDSDSEDVGEVMARFFEVVPEAACLDSGVSPVPSGWGKDPLVWEMGVRMVFSALVDADHLDTAAHFEGLDTVRVAAQVDMGVLRDRFEGARSERFSGVVPSLVNEIRSSLYARVVGAAGGGRGIYRLPAPTGSGKTVSSAGFALHHAARHRMSRVVVAVPFTTITSQNAQVYRDLLGPEVVLEHHSNAEFDGRDLRLAAENWDAPFVVTTTVQLFDSLFGRKPARSRKLHRLANAVIVLDEVQALPLSLLGPILDGLRLLCRHFGATVLLASATQPPFERLAVWKSLDVVELGGDAVALSTGLRRAAYEWRLDPRPTTDQIAAEAAEVGQALVVVNTVPQARAMVRAVAAVAAASATVLHLSTRMVPVHRDRVLAQACDLVKSGDPVLLVSTQLVEAGVDVDFPVVFRALAPAESLQQAAGRANREGRRSGLGRVVVFDAEGTTIPAFYRAGVAKTLAFFGPGKADPGDPQVLARYYASLYSALNVDADPRAVEIQRNRGALDYLAVAEGPVTGLGDADRPLRDSRLAFRMIDEDQVTVVVTDYDNNDEVRECLRRVRAGDGPLGALVRRMRPYMLSLPRSVASRPEVASLLRPVVAGQRDLWEWVGHYDQLVGLDDGDTSEETVW